MLVEITCPHCKNAINIDIGIKKQYQCPSCNQIVLQKVVEPPKYITDPQDEYFVDIPYDLPNETVDDMIFKKKVDDSISCLNNRNFSTSAALDHTLFALRLNMLHAHRVCNEKELAMTSRKLFGPAYDKFIAACDNQTKQVYHKIEQQIENNIQIDAEIDKVKQIWDVHLYDEGLDYATQMLEKYPNKALAHARYIYVKYWYYHLRKYHTITVGKHTVSNGPTALALTLMLHRDEFLADIARFEQTPDYNLVYGDYQRGRSLYGYLTDDWNKYLHDVVFSYMKNPYKNCTTPEALSYIKEQEKLAKKQKKNR